MKLKDKFKELNFQKLVIRKGSTEYTFDPPYKGIESNLLNSSVIGYEIDYVANIAFMEVSNDYSK